MSKYLSNNHCSVNCSGGENIVTNRERMCSRQHVNTTTREYRTRNVTGAPDKPAVSRLLQMLLTETFKTLRYHGRRPRSRRSQEVHDARKSSILRPQLGTDHEHAEERKRHWPAAAAGSGTYLRRIREWWRWDQLPRRSSAPVWYGPIFFSVRFFRKFR